MDRDQSGNLPSLEETVGAAIREQRQRHSLTLAQVAEQAGISRGMLSKIENGQTTAGMDTLARIARVLGVSMSMLFSKYDATSSSAQHIKKGAGMEVVRRGTKSGHTYHLLAYDQGPVKLFEPFLITIEDDSERYPTFEHRGTSSSTCWKARSNTGSGRKPTCSNPVIRCLSKGKCRTGRNAWPSARSSSCR